MWKDSRRLLVVSGLLALLMGDPAGAVKPKDPGDYLNQKEFFKPELYISSSHEPLAEVLGSLPNRQAWEGFLEAEELNGGVPVQAFVNPRSGAATNLVGAFPLIPGSGVGNQVTIEELGARIGRPVSAVDEEAVTDAVTAFVRGHAGILGVSLAQLGTVRSVQVNPDLWQVSIEQTYNGIPVRHGRLAASISHGNLVVIGTETWGDVRGLSTAAKVSAADALTTGFNHAGGRSAGDEIRRPLALEILPVAPQEHQQGEGFAGPVGAGLRHRLVWTYVFQRRPEHALWEVIVDAHDGELLAFQDIIQYASHSITGGVYPLTSTEICPNAQTCGTMQSGWPMPFADTGLAAPNDFTNSGGIFNWTSGTTTTTLSGRFVEIFDDCGALSQSTATGSILLGGLNGQHDCTSVGSAGNTASSRSAYYEINKLAEQARGWLPANLWLQNPLPTNVNITDTCNAFYDFFSINFFRSGGGCRNTGEIASVFDHEWGHGLDDNDSGGALSNSSEAYADIASIFRLQTSCLGHGFFETVNDGCGMTTDGTGFNVNEAQVGASHCVLDCSGVRDADWDKHADHTPDTALGFVCNSCVPSSGPCGRQVHCAAAPSRQAAWDLVARDLQQAPFNLSSQTAFLIGNKLFYQGSGNIGEWHACTCGGTSSGCGATNGYMQWLTADDDNGNLADGTPHMTAIYNAFNRHGIACAAPAPVNSGCAGGPSAQATLNGTPGSLSAGLSWTSVPSASKYWVFRSEGHAGCDFGKTKIAETVGLFFTDTEVAGGRNYYYNVVAAGSSPACFGPASNCVTVTPTGSSSPCRTLTRAHTGSGGDPTALPGNSDGCPAGQYHPGEIIQLTATPDPGWIAGSWTGTDNDSLANNVNFVTMPDSNRTVTVNYGQLVSFASFAFETNPLGMILSGLWHRTAACDAADPGHSLPVALYYGIDAQCDYENFDQNSGTATLPAISLHNVQAPVLLNLNYFLATESLQGFDVAFVEVSVNGGPYQILASNLGEGVVLSDPSSGWKPLALDLSAYAGSSVQIRFSFDTGDGLFNEFPGFYVDDVTVSTVCNGTSDISLSNQTFTTTQVFEACHTITANPNVVIGSGGNVTFKAIQRVTLGPGFKVLPGGALKVVLP